MELSIKDLGEIKLKEISEDCNRKMATFMQAIDHKISLTNENLIKSEDKTKEIL